MRERSFLGPKAFPRSCSPKSDSNGPICFSAHLDRARNRIERLLDRLRQCRRAATRYETCRYSTFASVVAADGEPEI
jgi:transposase